MANGHSWIVCWRDVTAYGIHRVIQKLPPSFGSCLRIETRHRRDCWIHWRFLGSCFCLHWWIESLLMVDCTVVSYCSEKLCVRKQWGYTRKTVKFPCVFVPTELTSAWPRQFPYNDFDRTPSLQDSSHFQWGAHWYFDTIASLVLWKRRRVIRAMSGMTPARRRNFLYP